MRILIVTILISIIFFGVCSSGYSYDIHGIIMDGKNKELLVGATVYIKELKKSTSSGLDGSYHIKNIPKGSFTLVCSYTGYISQEKTVSVNDSSIVHLNFFLIPVTLELKEVVITANKVLNTETSARESERESVNLMNVVSARTIELSPDLDVASVAKRMSGVTLAESSSGRREYAIIRGMDERYSTTLVNGIQIPSTDYRDRYVSLNLFPSDLVDRIEVSKVLTPDMEGDAIAGTVNLVMKNAPDNFIVQVNESQGYSMLWDNNKFQTFDKSPISLKSPWEQNGPEVYAVPGDFPRQNLDLFTARIPINTTAGITIGNRFFKKRLGWILAASYDDIYRGTNIQSFDDSQSTDGKNLPVLSDMMQRMDYNHQTNYGIHNKLDFNISPNNSIEFYTVYINYTLIQVRDIEETLFDNNYSPQTGNVDQQHTDQNRFNLQNLLNTTLQGNHTFGKFSVQWSAVYSKANNKSPDNSTITYVQNYVNHILQPQYVDENGSDRLWLHNTDEDKAGYLNLKYKTNFSGGRLELKTGALYRDKQRTSFYNDYTLIPVGTSPSNVFSVKGINWFNYSDINWKVQDPLGSVNTPGTFDAFEYTLSEYGMFQYEINKFKIIGGARYEEIRLGFNELFPNTLPGLVQSEDHINFFLLPSINARYAITAKSNIKASYFEAINKPSFLEIVPYVDNSGDYPKTGNPNLKDAFSYNYDLRYEYFPNKLDQVLLGAFYKKIDNAIEEGFFKTISGTYELSTFNSDATNYGFEVDLIKYFSKFGIKANYTWTQSVTSSYKRAQVNGKVNNDSTISILVHQPLDQQSKNAGNLSLLYRGANNGYNAQVSLSYTGSRIYHVSPDLNGDLWQRGFLQLDISGEKKFKHGFGIFVKARNLLNTRVIVFLKEKNPLNNEFPDQTEYDNTTLIRNEYSKPNFLVGIRYKFESRK